MMKLYMSAVPKAYLDVTACSHLSNPLCGCNELLSAVGDPITQTPIAV